MTLLFRIRFPIASPRAGNETSNPAFERTATVQRER